MKVLLKICKEEKMEFILKNDKIKRESDEAIEIL